MKFVPRVLVVEQKQQCLSISLELRDCAASDSSFYEMSREMKLESMIVILRPEFRVLNGNHPVLLMQKKRVNQDPTSR